MIQYPSGENKATINADHDYRAFKFLEEAQEDHFKKFGVYFDTYSKIAEIMELYADSEIERRKNESTCSK